MPTAQDVYTSAVAALPRSERLRLAAMILQDLAATGAAALDFSDAWTEQDEQDLRNYSLRHAATVYPEEDELV